MCKDSKFKRAKSLMEHLFLSVNETETNLSFKTGFKDP